MECKFSHTPFKPILFFQIFLRILKETWYSQRVLPGRGLRIPGRHVNSEGFICDKDGYICVASSDYKKGTIIETSRGMGKVYDCGCASGILDLYVNW